jgi:glucokinase
MIRLLAGDIGGTKTILRLNQVQGDCAATVLEKTYRSADYSHLNLMIQDFLAEVGGEPPKCACLAIAGPVVDQVSQLSNLSWHLDAHQMQQDLNIPIIQLINDFAAVGYGVLALEPQDILVLQQQPSLPQQPIAIIGAGTGLGEALLVWQSPQYQVLSLEGGHTDFPPRNQQEIELLQFLLKKYPRVSVERVLSGRGICRIYEFLRQSKFAPESPAVAAEMANQDPAAVITHQALSQSDPLCIRTLEMFVAIYGAEAGNLALKSLPYGGLYIAGGIGAKIQAKLQDGTFMANFLDKGRMRSLLEKIPVSLILNPKVGLIGAALLAERLLQQTPLR